MDSKTVQNIFKALDRFGVATVVLAVVFAGIYWILTHFAEPMMNKHFAHMEHNDATIQRMADTQVEQVGELRKLSADQRELLDYTKKTWKPAQPE